MGIPTYNIEMICHSLLAKTYIKKNIFNIFPRLFKYFKPIYLGTSILSYHLASSSWNSNVSQI